MSVNWTVIPRGIQSRGQKETKRMRERESKRQELCRSTHVIVPKITPMSVFFVFYTPERRQ